MTALNKQLYHNPNQIAEKKPQVPHATFCPGRRTKPEFAIHKNRGHALTAFKEFPAGILYKQEGNEWVEIYRVDEWQDAGICYNCGNVPTYRYRTWTNLHTDSPKLVTTCGSHVCEKALKRKPTKGTK